MGNILVVVETSPDGSLRKATFNALGAAKQLAETTGGAVHAVVLAADPAALATQVAACGAAVVHAGAGTQFAHPLAEFFAPAVAQVAAANDVEYVVGAGTAFGRDVMPRIAARLKAGMASEVLSISAGPDITFVRPMWAGAVLATVKLTSKVKVLTVRPTEFPPPSAGARGEIRALNADPVATRVSHVEMKEVKSARPNLTEAKVVVSGGRGTKGDFKLVEALADAFGAAIGASRAVCDAGWQPNDLQVGQTGKVVAPQLYVAVGISGAIQHVAGMKSSKTIVAINKDPEAPIFAVADYGLVADLFTALPELTAAIKAAR